MAGAGDKVQLRHPDPGKSAPRIDRDVYDAFRRALLRAIPAKGDGVEFRALSRRVGELLPQRVRARIGSVGWYTTTVKLDLEARGDIRRVAGARPQRLLRTR
jgi:hypothetical protein